MTPSSKRRFVHLRRLFAVGTLLATVPTSTGAASEQAAHDAPASRMEDPAAVEETPLETSWGVANLQGTWDFRTATPLWRPDEFKDREFLTAEEIDEWQRRVTEEHQSRLRASAADEPSQSDLDVGYDFFFLDHGAKITGTRTSLIVDPPNGRVPMRTLAAQMRMAENRERWERRPLTPADRPPVTRCLVGFNAGPPMRAGGYNNIMRVFQARGYVAILNEMVNDHRVIPTDDGDHLPSSVRLWKGDSRGRWEGDSLVVETTNFTPHTSFRGSGPNMVLTERFTRLDADTLRYEYTVDDPESFAAPWSAVQDMRATEDQVYEYACHEGNRAMHLMLAGARREEREGVADKKGWLPTWYRGLPKKEALLAEAANAERAVADAAAAAEGD